MFTDQIEFQSFVHNELLSIGVKERSASSIAGWIQYECEQDGGRATQGQVIITIETDPVDPNASSAWARPDIQCVTVRDNLGIISSYVEHPIHQPIAPHLLAIPAAA